jgi:hypothetical protein
MGYIATARAYNHLTGANITHWDAMNWGFTEETIVSHAIDLLMDKK